MRTEVIFGGELLLEGNETGRLDWSRGGSMMAAAKGGREGNDKSGGCAGDAETGPSFPVGIHHRSRLGNTVLRKMMSLGKQPQQPRKSTESERRPICRHFQGPPSPDRDQG
jgi:hypothetical protein